MALIEEYKDGRKFQLDTGANIVGTFLRFGEIFSLLLVLLIVFLRKYHAGEVGVRTSTAVFGAALGLGLLFTALICKWSGLGSTLGDIDARQTTFAIAGFKFLFYDIPLAVLVFLAWSVGESIARERWGDRLASFDALLRRDPVNATVGGALVNGLLAAPAVAAAALLPPLVPLLWGRIHGALGSCAAMVLNSSGGAGTVIVASALDAIVFASVGLLSLLGFGHRKRLLGLGVALAVAFGTMMSIVPVPVAPFTFELLLGFGGPLACVAVFLASDLLAATTALLLGTLMLSFLPLLRELSGPALAGPLTALLLPFLALAALAGAGIATKRPVAYSHADLAPHVKRIVERERIKAEIDAANRIQAALLPAREPELDGTSVASHYRAATEIGGDYFDFLPLAQGRLGIAFGDVSGHGLTSGIVMAMAKAALLVQTGYDASPARVLEVLNETVRRTAPRRILMTFFFGILDADAGLLRFASAGHLDPYVFRARERRLEALSAWGFPLGVKRREPFHERTVSFQPGDRLILYSDGLIEALDDDGEPFGFERFEDVLLRNGDGRAGEIRDALLKSIRLFTRNRPPEDDQTLVVVSFEEDDVASLPRAG